MARRSIKQHNELRGKVLADPIARAEYEAFKVQLDLAAQLKSARHKAHLTQENVAKKMGLKSPLLLALKRPGVEESIHPQSEH